MKKLISLIKATMTSNMQIFKINTKGKKGKTNIMLVSLIAIYLMGAIFGYAWYFLDKLSQANIEYLLLPLAVFFISLFTIVEGIYKCGPLVFNCKDDQLLLSLPIKKNTVLFIRLFKFYVFELMFNTLFLLPVLLAYIIFVKVTSISFYIATIIMLLLLPVIPIVISCILGFISSYISSKFKYKNVIEIIMSFIYLLFFLYVYSQGSKIMNYIMNNASNINDMITKIYYPAGIYSKLVTNFNIVDLLLFIVINISILVVSIYILSLFYFKINSNLKEITKTKSNNKELKIKTNTKTVSLIKKELNSFFNIPIFIVNAGFGMVLYIVMCIVIITKFDGIINMINSTGLINISDSLIYNNMPLIIFLLISLTAYTTSITSSMVSLEGKNINILKSLPLSVKKILRSKILACMLITTPVLVFGCIALIIKFKVNIINGVMLIILSVLIPLVNHFIGLIVNLKHPKLDFESPTDVIKQSASVFISSMIGVLLLLASIGIVLAIFNKFNITLFLLISLIVYIVIDYNLYRLLNKVGIREFKKLSV
jgi:ABC-2 type transport system permease protein